jgi:hypothetical protein
MAKILYVKKDTPADGGNNPGLFAPSLRTESPPMEREMAGSNYSRSLKYDAP